MLFNGLGKDKSGVRTAPVSSWRNLSGRVSKGVGIGGIILGVIIASVTKGFVSRSVQKSIAEDHTRSITSGQNLTVTETSDFSVELPDIFKESNLPLVNKGGSDTESLKSYEAGDIVATVCRTPYTEDEKNALNSGNKKEYLQTLSDGMKSYTTLSYSVISSEVVNDNCILLQINLMQSGLFKDTDRVYLISMLYYADDYSYELDLSCSQDNKSKYADSMEQWAKTFKVK